MCTRADPKNVVAGTKKQLLATGIEESTGICQVLLVSWRRYPGDGQRQRISHLASDDDAQRPERLL